MPDPAPHPATQAFPMLSEDELLALAADIAQNGLILPIMLSHDGKWVLDGRNRKRACEMANIPPRYDYLPEGMDPIAYIYSTNITRRNMTKGQQALALAMLYPEGPGAGGARGRKIDPAIEQIHESGICSYERLRQARQIVQHPDLAIGVRDGGVKFETAFKEAQLRDEVATAAKSHMYRLRNEAPDLADQVDEETLTLPEAVGAYNQRLAEVEKAELAKREQLKQDLIALRRLRSYAMTQTMQDIAGAWVVPDFHDWLVTAFGGDGAAEFEDTVLGAEALNEAVRRSLS